ncbi:MAG: O-antigen ligase family protein [Patescibacteria group bacterium]|jgi:O-antigen ligase
MQKMALLKNNYSAWWFYIILFCLPSYVIRFKLFNIPVTVLEGLILIGFILLCVEYRCKLTLGHWKYVMSVFAVIGLLAVLVSDEKVAALGLYKAYIIEPMLVGCMVLTIKPKLERVLTTLSGVIILIGITCVIQLGTGYGVPAPWHEFGAQFRATSWFGYPNAVGLLCAPIVAMLIAHVVSSTKYRTVFFVAIVLGLVSIILSRSAGAVMAVTGATIVGVYLAGWKKLSVLSVFICVSTIPLFRETVLFQDVSGQVRLALWQGTINLLQHRPLQGAGLANFPNVYAEYKLARHTELLLYPHNIFLDFWVELGLAGLIWLIVVLVVMFKKIKTIGWQQPKAVVLLAGLVAVLIYGLVDVPYFKNDLAVLFWVILTL